MKREGRLKIGIIGRQILKLIELGICLGLTYNYKRRSWILKNIPKELNKIKVKNLNAAIRKLYESRLIDYQEKESGIVVLTLTEEGKKKVLSFKIDEIKLKKQSKWDGFWRIVIFDIPEKFKQGRNAFAKKLREIGMHPLQKSVYVYPYDCKDELDFIIEYFNLRPYVRFGLLKEIDNELHLKKIFSLI